MYMYMSTCTYNLERTCIHTYTVLSGRGSQKHRHLRSNPFSINVLTFHILLRP